MILSNAFAALGDPNRLAIVEMLLNEGEKNAGEIAGRVPVSAPAVSRHLRVLTEAGLISRRVDRQRRIYSVDAMAMGRISDWLQLHIDIWEAKLDRLQAAVEKGADNG